MSRFYVGQRVRIVDAGQSKSLIGSETVVIALDVDANCSLIGEYVGIKVEAINKFGRRFVALPHWLEPITDPGREVVSWEACEWKPEHLRSRVEVGP